MKTTRRAFVAGSFAASVGVVLPRLYPADTPAPAPTAPTELARKREPQDPERVFEFVRVGHGNLARVREMLALDPRLVLASWDWGGGDWETALEGAAHVGNREIALYLLEHGARHTLTCAAMLGERDTILAAVHVHPALANTAGPHGLTLLYHAAISGDVALAEGIAPLIADRTRHANQALSAAARGGHVAMTTWLLANGVTDPNVADGIGKTAATYAADKNFPEIAELLRKHAAR